MNAEAALTVGVDLGGTKVEAALVNSRGEVVGASRRPTSPERGANGVLDDLVGCLAEDCLPAAKHPVLAVGVGVRLYGDACHRGHRGLNVERAAALGMRTIHYHGPEQLRRELASLHVAVEERK